jgi:hypothetical protein
VIAFKATPASIVTLSIVSAPASPRRLRHRVMIEGSMGISCSKKLPSAAVLPVGFSAQRATAPSVVGEVIPIFQIMQRHHQPCINPGAPVCA